MTQEKEIVQEFLVESHENLARLDLEMVELEQRPRDGELLASIFRTIHTIKGTCGFLGFAKLESVTHVAENLLSQLRNGERDLTPGLVSLILETADVAKRELAAIESTGEESGQAHESLLARLRSACENKNAAPREESAPPCESVASVPESGPKSRSAASDGTVRVDVGLLDRLMNLVGELVLARNEINQGCMEATVALQASAQRLSMITSELQADVMKTRMQPVGTIWGRLPRVVRDLAHSCGKQIQLDLHGADTELDRTVVEAIKDPLVQIVRNACDHGIERPEVRVAAGKPATGTLSLHATHAGGQVLLTVTDDGAGIDPQRIKAKAVRKGLIRQDEADVMSDQEAVNLVCLPGFSTAEQVTNISGRGVGMDVVKTNVDRIGGSLDIVSTPGHGTTIRVRIPLTLAIIPGLVVAAGGQEFIIPQAGLVELVRLEGDAVRDQIAEVHGMPVYRLRGGLLPLVHLHRVLRRA